MMLYNTPYLVRRRHATYEYYETKAVCQEWFSKSHKFLLFCLHHVKKNLLAWKLLSAQWWTTQQNLTQHCLINKHVCEQQYIRWQGQKSVLIITLWPSLSFPWISWPRKSVLCYSHLTRWGVLKLSSMTPRGAPYKKSKHFCGMLKRKKALFWRRSLSLPSS